ncbi:hypothetical protein [Micromonospora sagamiensis]|uniref:Uncharacterized protein n=1 Tax=Micromonospora sagamiensis TaxID=47875 RepID=A0A562WJD0_9ACTN|nr:hypothetical protein [Micromonospora sagamiensis]TWJ30272.1 hypothetical protein JD81_03810 [Micromonospora sagamiensis]BCL16698.1 hypothetical protein GCM10017556_44370 [Micromonospora sagamiensis]
MKTLVIGALLIAGLLAGAAWFVVGAVRTPTALHGSLTVEWCEFRGRGGDMASCTGTFRADDGTVTAADVTVDLKRKQGWLDYSEPVPARLTGPAAAVADEAAFVGRASQATIAVVLLGWAVAQTVWWVRHYRRTHHVS